MHISATLAAVAAIIVTVLVALPVHAENPMMPGAGNGNSGGYSGFNEYGERDGMGPMDGTVTPRGTEGAGSTRDTTGGTATGIPENGKKTDADKTGNTNGANTADAGKTNEKPGTPATDENGKVDPDDSQSTNKSGWAVFGWIIAAIAAVVIVCAVVAVSRKRRR